MPAVWVLYCHFVVFVVNYDSTNIAECWSYAVVGGCAHGTRVSFHHFWPWRDILLQTWRVCQSIVRNCCHFEPCGSYNRKVRQIFYINDYLFAFTVVLSITHHINFCIYRFIVIVIPIKCRWICTVTNCKRSLVIVWALSLVLAVPVLFTKVIMIKHWLGPKGPHLMLSRSNPEHSRPIAFIWAVKHTFAFVRSAKVACIDLASQQKQKKKYHPAYTMRFLHS